MFLFPQVFSVNQSNPTWQSARAHRPSIRFYDVKATFFEESFSLGLSRLYPNSVDLCLWGDFFHKLSKMFFFFSLGGKGMFWLRPNHIV